MFDRILDLPVGQRRLPYGGPCAYALEAESEPYFYNPVEKRDPFLSPFHTAQKQAVVREAKTPLQRFDLRQVKQRELQLMIVNSTPHGGETNGKK